MRDEESCIASTESSEADKPTPSPGLRTPAKNAAGMGGWFALVFALLGVAGVALMNLVWAFEDTLIGRWWAGLNDMTSARADAAVFFGSPLLLVLGLVVGLLLDVLARRHGRGTRVTQSAIWLGSIGLALWIATVLWAEATLFSSW